MIGFTQFERSVQLQARAIRAYLGLPKNSCRVGVLSEVDWLLPEYRTRLKIIRQYTGRSIQILALVPLYVVYKVYVRHRSVELGLCRLGVVTISMTANNFINGWCDRPIINIF